jgi:hypothetical protein
MLPHRFPVAPALVALAAVTAFAVGCEIPVFLADADLNDDGWIDAADAAVVEACLGTELPAPEIEIDAFLCPTALDPDPTGCAAADVDRNGRVDARDLGLVTERLGKGVCNGSDALCGRRFDQVAFPTTHNAMAALRPPYDYSPLIANQCSGVPRQLADGVRALMLDFHWYQPPEASEPDLYLCHSECPLGHQRLEDGLAEVRAFLASHPGEVVSFIVETDDGTVGREAQIRDAFAASGLLPFVHTQTPGQPWPTLAEMVDSGHRLVVLTDDPDNSGCGGADPCPWYEYVWTFAFETPFSFSTPEAFTCVDNRGEPPADLFILNHFLTGLSGSPFLADMVNHDPGLTARALDCWSFQGRIPNFVTVDFYEIGDLLRTTDLVNYLWGQTHGSAPY